MDAMESSAPHRICLVIDIGSSSVRTCAFVDGVFTSIPASRRLMSLLPSGCFDAERTFEACSESLTEAVAFAINAYPYPSAQAVTVLVSCFVSSFLASGTPDNRPLTPLFSYACRGGGGLTARNSNVSDATHYHDRIGAPLHPAYVPCMLPSSGGVQALVGGHSAAVWSSLTPWCIARWAGGGGARTVLDIGMSRSDAAWAGLLSWATGEYDPEAIALAGLRLDQLPPLRGTDEVVASCSVAEFLAQVGWASSTATTTAAATAAAQGIPASTGSLIRLDFHLAVGDGLAATIASTMPFAGCEGEGEASPALHAAKNDAVLTSPAPQRRAVLAITVGTSAAVRCLVRLDAALAALCDGRHILGDIELDNSSEIFDSSNTATAAVDVRCATCGKLRLSSLGLWCYRVSTNECLVGGALTDGGSAVAVLENQLFIDGTGTSAEPGAVENSDVDAALRPSPLLCLPFFSGERATGWNADARACFYGLSAASSTSPAAMVRAARDGVAFRIRAIAERLLSVLGSDEHRAVFALSGGAMAHSRAWASTIAAVLVGAAPRVPVYLQEVAPSSAAVAACPTSVTSPAAASSPSPEVTSLGVHLSFLRDIDNHRVGGSSEVLKVGSNGSRGELLIPSPQAVRAYATAYAAHCMLYDALAPVHSAIASMGMGVEV